MNTLNTLFWRFFAGLILNISICFAYTQIDSPDRKMGYFLQGLGFAFIHVLLGILLLVFRSKPGSFINFFCATGNGLFAFYFLFFSIDYSEGLGVSSMALVALPSIILFVGLQWRAWAETFGHTHESL